MRGPPISTYNVNGKTWYIIEKSATKFVLTHNGEECSTHYSKLEAERMMLSEK